jgi:putative transposase
VKGLTGKWFVTLVTELDLPEYKVPVAVDQVVGGDLGLNTYLTLSNGVEIENPRFLRQYAKKLRRANANCPVK